MNWCLTTPRLQGVLPGDCEDLDIEIVSLHWEGMSIINPWMSECSRFGVTPEHYGFEFSPEPYGLAAGPAWIKSLDDDHVLYVQPPEDGRSHIWLRRSFEEPRLHYSVTAGAGMTDFKKEN